MNLIEELVALQDRHGYLRDDDLHALAARTATPLHEIQGVSSFYPHFRRTPPPPLRLHVCRDLACHLRDRGRSLEDLRALCEGRDDIEFEPVSCLGRCDSAPACSLNGAPLPASQACDQLAPGAPPVSGAASGAAPSATPSAAPRATPEPSRRWQIDPHDTSEQHYSLLREWVDKPAGAARSRELIECIRQSGLRGMGGAGFPTGRKWGLVAETESTPRYVICNADESEPGTFKDRVVLDELPHLVLEGMLLAGLAIGSRQGWIYVRHEYAPETRRLRAAIERARELGALGSGIFGSDFDFDVEVFVSPGGYILGEETALLEALEGRRGEPRNKPPFPGVRGLHGQPTLINNVETFAQVPRILRTGQAELKLFSVSGDIERPDVVEAPLGTTARQLIDRCGGMRDDRELLAFLPGGASTGFLPARHADLPLDWEALQEIGSSLGSAAVLVVGEGADLRELAGNLTAFFRNESCGKCVPCRIGTHQAVGLIESGDAKAASRLRELHETLAATSICGLGQAALNPVLSVLDNFDDSVWSDTSTGRSRR